MQHTCTLVLVFFAISDLTQSVQYKVGVVDKIENTDWIQDWVSEIHIEANQEGIVERREYLTYDVTDLIADLGGYLGLLLGWSLLGISLYISNLLIVVKNYLIRKF